MKTEDINIRDPYTLPYDGVYYMYGSRTGKQFGFDVYKSTDLKNWSESKSVLEASEVQFENADDFWAPEVHIWNGKFYMFASLKNKGECRGTYIFVSDTPDGKFTVYSGRITPKNWECLDGTFYAENGVPYMVFCHEWTQIGNGEVCAVELESDLSKSKGEPFVLWTAGEAAWTEAFGKQEGKYVTDGPFLFHSKDGRLMSLWSSFGKDGYALARAYSSNGKIRGEWIAEEKPVFSDDGGHAMIFETFENKRMLVLHSPNSAFNERPTFLEIDF